MKYPLSSVTVVIVVHDQCPEPEELHHLSRTLEGLFVDFEYVIVAQPSEAGTALELKQLVETLPDSLIVFLGEQVHDDLARLIGIDHAVSDYILFATPSSTETSNLARLVEPLKAGADVVIGSTQVPTRRGVFNRMLFSAFQAVFKLCTGKVFEDQPPSFRILSRAAALHAATRKDGEVLVRARSLGSGFPVAEIEMPDQRRSRRAPSLRRDLTRGTRLIATSSATVFRTSAYLAVISGIGSALYGLYALLIYFLKAEVQPGWTTLSLQMSGMMLLFSIQFLLLAEHVIQIASNSSFNNRQHYILRELRSAFSRRSARLNVVDQEGRFALGAPTSYAPVGPRGVAL
jgi:polyisoprenyl-phosphate glycosyltransferase